MRETLTRSPQLQRSSKNSRFHGRKVPINAINNRNGQADVYVTVMGMSNEAFTGSLRATFAHADVKRKKVVWPVNNLL